MFRLLSLSLAFVITTSAFAADDCTNRVNWGAWIDQTDGINERYRTPTPFWHIESVAHGYLNMTDQYQFWTCTSFNKTSAPSVPIVRCIRANRYIEANSLNQLCKTGQPDCVVQIKEYMRLSTTSSWNLVATRKATMRDVGSASTISIRNWTWTHNNAKGYFVKECIPQPDGGCTNMDIVCD